MSGGKTDENQLQELMAELDYAGNGKINYSEFLAATVNARTFFDDTRLRVVFSMFDIKGNNEISPEEMKIAFQKLG